MQDRWTASIVLSFVCSVVTPGRAAAGGSGDTVFEPLALRWAERHGVDVESARATGIPGLLQEHFARFSLGTLDVYLPPEALADGGRLDEAREALTALALTEATWASWMAASKPLAIDKGPLARWMRSWKPADLAGTAGVDLVQHLEAPARARAELDALAAALPEGRASLVVFPARETFVEFTALAGLLHEDQRAGAWQEGLATWLEYDADGLRFVTLEYTSGSSDWSGGVSVASRNPRALGELVSQVASRVLLDKNLAPGADPALSSALANAMVIDLFDELDTRVDGDVRARSSQGTSVFVPGGNPNGGVLPATSAENRWRGTRGKDHFVTILAQVQERSGKRLSKAERMVSFELQDDSGASGAVARAPFLGPGGTAAPPEAWADSLELMRCYGIAFVHWLRTEGGGRGKASERHFSELLRGLGTRGNDLPKLFHEVYQTPLSAPNAEALFGEDTLEGRFLTWLSKQA
jgi:hypothetical protein